MANVSISILKIGDRWRAQVRPPHGKSKSKTLPTQKEARAWAKDIARAMEDGKPVVVSSSVTVGKLIKTFREMRDRSRPILDTSNEHYILNRLDDMLGDTLAGALSIDDIMEFAEARRGEGAGPYTINMDLSKLGTVYRYAGAKLRLLLPDPVGAARPILAYSGLIGGGGHRIRRPEEDELTRIIDWLAKNKGQKFADAVEFAAINAMRRGEIGDVLWQNLNEAKRLLGVWRKHPRKGKVWELVPILPPAWEIIQRQPKESDGDDPRIFRVHPQTLSKYFRAACAELGIPDLHFHDLRHEGTSRLFEDGYQIQEVALVTGHKDWRNLKRYTNLKPENLHARDAASATRQRPPPAKPE